MDQVYEIILKYYPPPIYIDPPLLCEQICYSHTQQQCATFYNSKTYASVLNAATNISKSPLRGGVVYLK